MDPEDRATAWKRASAARPGSPQADDVSRRVADGTPAEPDYQAAWRHTLTTVKEALADLEAAANRTPVEPMMAVSSLVERLVAVATAAADAAGQHIRAEARAEVAQTQALVAQVRAELEREREQLKAASQSLDTERTARGRAEAALEEAREASERRAAVYESQIRSLGAELETVRALSTELDTVRADLDRTRKELEADRVALETNRVRVETQQAEITSHRAELASLRQTIDAERAERAALVAAIKQAIGETDSTPIPEARPKIVEMEPDRAEIQTDAIGPPAKPATHQSPELVAYARELLARTEALYRADVAARRSTADLIDRLTSSLRRARLAFARRMGATDLKDTTIFEQQLAEVLDSSEETTFSRHLGIAAYESLSKPGS